MIRPVFAGCRTKLHDLRVAVHPGPRDGLTRAAALSRRWIGARDAERSTRAVFMSLYVGCVIVAGGGLLLQYAPRTYPHPWLASLLLLAALILSAFKLRLPVGNSTMSMAYAVDFVALIIEGANLAMFLGAIGVLIQCSVRVRRKQPIHRAAFSAAAVIIAVQMAGWGWRALGGSLTTLTLTSTLLPLMACAITYYIVNTSLVVGAIAVTSAVSPARAWNPEFWRAAPAYLASAAIAGLVALAIINGVFVLLPIVASPLYVCYRAYHRRWTQMATELLNRAAETRTPVTA
jgi:uncharacterized protein (DUF983 family)